jgi:very-short-patch-repair endonuclease
VPNYKPKACELCNKEYTPTSPKQKYCSVCRDKGRKIADRKRDRKRSRQNNNYKEYERKCLSCGKKFETHYKRKKYCGSKECDRHRISIKNKRTHLKRDKGYMVRKGRRYYDENRELCLNRAADRYRRNNNDVKPYKPGKIHRHGIESVIKYIESKGYHYISGQYKNNRSKLLLKCPNGHEWETTFHNFKDRPNVKGNRCLYCYLSNNYTSRPELELRQFIEEELIGIEVVYNDRSVIGPKELDFYFPRQKLAIEVCGLYWHSDTAVGTERNYHYNKMMLCYDKGVRLITIFEDEIKKKFNLIKSRIMQALNISRNVIYARKCEVVQLGSKESNEFFNENHLQGQAPNKSSFGLLYDGKLVSVCSVGQVGRNHTSTAGTIELKRFCNLAGYHVVGAAGKLFKRVKIYAEANGYSIIKSYCDMRYANIFNPVYELLGFSLKALTKYTPHYFKGLERYRNMSLRKTKEERLLNKTEVELRVAQGYNRIWDCGHRTYEYIL